MKIPVVFAFDNNLIFPACVCISSLMMHARSNTFYEIFILYSEKEGLRKNELDKIPTFYSNCSISYRTVGDVFDQAFEIRGITTPAYYRLLIPELIPEYDKVIYSDVDVIFRMDLSELYAMDLKDNYIAATRDLGLNLGKDGIAYIKSMSTELHEGDYIQSGLIVLNNKAINNAGMVEVFKQTAKRKLKFQDQDTLNITCYGKIMYLPMHYNMTDYSFEYAIKFPYLLERYFTKEEVEFAKSNGNLHFNGHKPWKKYCINFDIWWDYYRRSPYYDEKFYFDFYSNKLNEFDHLTLMKRVKILLRYFIVR